MAPTFDQVFPVLYKGWDPASAQADFNAGNWKNKAGAQQFMGVQNPQDFGNNLINQSVNKFQEAQTQANQKFGDYQKANPFSFDEYLKGQATTMAKEQVDPYYNESLSNYLLGVSRKQQRSLSDTQDLVGELQATTKSFTENTKLALDEALNKSREGYADTGLFDSGQRYRSEGLTTQASGNAMDTFTRQQNLRQKGYETGNQRTLEDLALGKTMDVRNLERSRATDIGVQAGQLTKEAGQNYVRGFQQTLPAELQANTNFDLLKQIGVYS